MKVFRLLLWQYMQAGLRQGGQFLASILFALVVVLLFAFVWPDLAPAERISVLVGEVFLTIFFALQLGFMRSFEIEVDDDAFSLLRLYPVPPSLWFLAKVVHVFGHGLLLALITFFIALFVNEGLTTISGPGFAGSLLVLAMSVAAIAAVGTLLAVVTLGARARQLVYPALYFPLTIPVLLAGVEAMRALLLGTTEWHILWGSWLGLLALFLGAYLILGLLLYGELVGVAPPRPPALREQRSRKEALP